MPDSPGITPLVLDLSGCDESAIGSAYGLTEPDWLEGYQRWKAILNSVTIPDPVWSSPDFESVLSSVSVFHKQPWVLIIPPEAFPGFRFIMRSSLCGKSLPPVLFIRYDSSRLRKVFNRNTFRRRCILWICHGSPDHPFEHLIERELKKSLRHGKAPERVFVWAFNQDCRCAKWAKSTGAFLGFMTEYERCAFISTAHMFWAYASGCRYPIVRVMSHNLKTLINLEKESDNPLARLASAYFASLTSRERPIQVFWHVQNHALSRSFLHWLTFLWLRYLTSRETALHQPTQSGQFPVALTGLWENVPYLNYLMNGPLRCWVTLFTAGASRRGSEAHTSEDTSLSVNWTQLKENRVPVVRWSGESWTPESFLMVAMVYERIIWRVHDMLKLSPPQELYSFFDYGVEGNGQTDEKYPSVPLQWKFPYRN